MTVHDHAVKDPAVLFHAAGQIAACRLNIARLDADHRFGKIRHISAFRPGIHHPVGGAVAPGRRPHIGDGQRAGGGADDLSEQRKAHGVAAEGDHIPAGDAAQLGKPMGILVMSLFHAESGGLFVHHGDEIGNIACHIAGQRGGGLIAGGDQQIIHQLPHGDLLSGQQVDLVHPVAVLGGDGLLRHHRGAGKLRIIFQHQHGGHHLGHAGGGIFPVNVFGEKDGVGGLLIDHGHDGVGDLRRIRQDGRALCGRQKTAAQQKGAKQKGKKALFHFDILTFLCNYISGANTLASIPKSRQSGPGWAASWWVTS